MAIQSIRLQKFRSYTDDSFEFDLGVNIIVGPNAIGKTNLLEALVMICLGSSYRTRDSELMRFGQSWSRLDAHVHSQQRTIKLVLDQAQGSVTKTIEIDGRSHKRLPLPKTIPVVLFEPQHLTLLSGPPELRRNFIDELLERIESGFGVLTRQYRRALSQRNALLKSGRSASGNQLFAWNVRLSELGGRIVTHRCRLLKVLNSQLPAVYSSIAHLETNVELVYESSCRIGHYETDLLKKLEAGAQLDYERGFTAYGPHRDDIVPYLKGRRIQETASRGEVRSLLLALKILELQLLEDSRGQTPVLLLDDVFSELDGARRRALTELIKGYQTFITTTDADVVVQHFMNDCHIIPL